LREIGRAHFPKTALKQPLQKYPAIVVTAALCQTRHDETEDESMKRWFFAATTVGFIAVGAASSSIYAGSKSPDRFIPGVGPITEQQIRDKLTADGFSNIQITPEASIFQTNATKDGRVLRLAIDAQSGTVLRVQDDDDDD
jgi:hypothetical protein